jgi:hypothetical protein
LRYREAGQLALSLDRGAAYSHREGQRAAAILHRPVDDLLTFEARELVDLGRQSQHGDAGRAGPNDCLHLSAHGFPIELVVTIEIRVENRIDACDLRFADAGRVHVVERPGQ